MNRIRITGGTLKGRTIALAKGGSARYTSGKLREAVFNLVGPIDGAQVLDLFAGAGSFTIEALSRGAGSAVSVERDHRTAEVLSKNLKAVFLDKDCLVMNMEVRYAIPMLERQNKIFDLIFIDPPYEMGYAAKTIDLLSHHRIYHEESIVLLEHSKREEAPLGCAGLQALSTRRYGDTLLSIFRPASALTNFSAEPEQINQE